MSIPSLSSMHLFSKAKNKQQTKNWNDWLTDEIGRMLSLWTIAIESTPDTDLTDWLMKQDVMLTS